MNSIFAMLMLLTPDNLDNPTFRVMETFKNIDECEATLLVQVNPNIIPLLKCFEMKYNTVLPAKKEPEPPKEEPKRPCIKCRET